MGFSSCKIEKRLHSNGYYVEFNKSSSKSLKKVSSPQNVIKKLSFQNDLSKLFLHKNNKRLTLSSKILLSKEQTIPLVGEKNEDFIEVVSTFSDQVENNIVAPPTTSPSSEPDIDLLVLGSVLTLIFGIAIPVINFLTPGYLVLAILTLLASPLGLFFSYFFLKRTYLRRQDAKPKKIQVFSFYFFTIFNLLLAAYYLAGALLISIFIGLSGFEALFAGILILFAAGLGIQSIVGLVKIKKIKKAAPKN